MSFFLSKQRDRVFDSFKDRFCLMFYPQKLTTLLFCSIKLLFAGRFSVRVWVMWGESCSLLKEIRRYQFPTQVVLVTNPTKYLKYQSSFRKHDDLTLHKFWKWVGNVLYIKWNDDLMMKCVWKTFKKSTYSFLCYCCRTKAPGMFQRYIFMAAHMWRSVTDFEFYLYQPS